MKLFSKYNRISLLTTVIIFLLSSIAFYFLLRYLLVEQVDENLEIEQREIQSYVKLHNKFPETIQVKDQLTDYAAVSVYETKKHFSTTWMYDPDEQKNGYFRQIRFYMKIDEQSYRITVSKSMEGTEDMIKSIIIITVTTILVILITTILINRLVLRRLWKPFYGSLEVMRSFQLGRGQALQFPSTDIEEFSLMNNTLNSSLQKAEQDYLLLKEFTENASHELQTPLAIIRSKLDLLVQDENLTEKQVATVQSADDAVQKLARLNQSLLLLAKIENLQFAETNTQEIDKKIADKMALLKELFDSRQLNITTSLAEVTIRMNDILLDVLFNNLFSNVVRYTPPGGNIKVELTETYLKICNSAANGMLDKTKLFTRFYKPEQVASGNGLGLSIIQQICEVSGFSITYSFADNEHCFCIVFK
ncbi:MAG: HAMP domain-containing histidine kinase [Filimonas sp.]|nr:HAMP domain-containing histidine kinase [Filimonas sp.]